MDCKLVFSNWKPDMFKLAKLCGSLLLSYLIFSYLILSYLILSYLILSYLILSYLILYYLILSYLILYYIINTALYLSSFLLQNQNTTTRPIDIQSILGERFPPRSRWWEIDRRARRAGFDRDGDRRCGRRVTPAQVDHIGGSHHKDHECSTPHDHILPRIDQVCNHSHCPFSSIFITSTLLVYTYHPTGDPPSLVTKCNHSHCLFSSLIHLPPHWQLAFPC